MDTGGAQCPNLIDTMDGATIGIVLGVVLGVLAVAAFSGFLYMRQKKKRSRLTTEATFNQKGKTAVAPQSNRIFRSQSVYVMSHDANDMNARRIISRTRSGLSLIFNEFDRDGDGQISEDEVSKAPSPPPPPQHTLYPSSIPASPFLLALLPATSFCPI